MGAWETRGKAKGDMLLGEREVDNRLPGDTTAGYIAATLK